jgi:hypothetical protein
MRKTKSSYTNEPNNSTMPEVEVRDHLVIRPKCDDSSIRVKSAESLPIQMRKTKSSNTDEPNNYTMPEVAVRDHLVFRPKCDDSSIRVKSQMRKDNANESKHDHLVIRVKMFSGSDESDQVLKVAIKKVLVCEAHYEPNLY